MKTKMEKWRQYKFSTGNSSGLDYLQFQKEAKAELKKMAKENGMVLHSFIKNHYEFSAVLKAETDAGDKFVYVSISDVRYFIDRWWNEVLYRTMKHDKDWTGGRNMRCCWTELGERSAQLVGNLQRKDKSVA